MKKSIQNAIQKNGNKPFPVFIFFVALLFATNFAIAQNKFSITFRPGLNFPIKDLGNANLKTGFGFEGTVGYKVLPHLNAYVGWGWNHFKADESFAGPDMDYEETGYSLGLHFIHPIENSKLSYMIGAGAIYNHIEIENSNGDLIADSGHGWGWRGEAGLDVPIANRLHLIPAIRYQSLTRDFTIGDGSTNADLNYVSFGVGVSWSF